MQNKGKILLIMWEHENCLVSVLLNTHVIYPLLSYASCKDLPHLWTKYPAMLINFCMIVWSVSGSSSSTDTMQIEQPDSLFPTGSRSFLRRFWRLAVLATAVTSPISKQNLPPLLCCVWPKNFSQTYLQKQLVNVTKFHFC